MALQRPPAERRRGTCVGAGVGGRRRGCATRACRRGGGGAGGAADAGDRDDEAAARPGSRADSRRAARVGGAVTDSGNAERGLPRRCRGLPREAGATVQREVGTVTDMSATQATADTHPIRLVNNDYLRRNMLTVFFRLILAIPHFIWLTLWLFVLYLVGWIFWLIALFKGRLPDGIHNFVSRFTRYSTHVYAYSSLLADPFPKFLGAEGTYPMDLQIDGPQEQNRLGILFRLLLAIPAFLLAYVLRLLMNVLAFVGWFYALFTGRMSEGIESLGAYALRYEAQTFGYAFLLTGNYPSLGGAPTA